MSNKVIFNLDELFISVGIDVRSEERRVGKEC